MIATGSAAANLPRSWGEYLSPAARVRIGIVAVLLVITYWGPIRHYLIGRWLNDGNWSHGWLIPLFSVYFLLCQKRRLFGTRPKPSYVGAVVLLLYIH